MKFTGYSIYNTDKIFTLIFFYKRPALIENLTKFNLLSKSWITYTTAL